jgi:hypothetical protein
MALLAKTAIEPLRIAFDDISMKELYISKVRLARDNGITDLSNYILYNFRDTPRDFYERLKINVHLNEELGTQIYSFPMKYVPLNAKDRTFIGGRWNRRLLRGVQCILLATRGLVSTKRNFFEAAFGESYERFLEILVMPDMYIIYRQRFKENGASDWRKLYGGLDPSQRQELQLLLSTKKIQRSDVERLIPSNFRKILEHYVEAAKFEAELKKGQPSGDKSAQDRGILQENLFNAL